MLIKYNILLLFIIITFHSNAEITINDSFTVQKIISGIHFIETDKATSINDILLRSDFKALTTEKLIGSNKTFWISFQLKNDIHTPVKLLLISSKFHNIEIFHNQELIGQGGLSFPISKRAYNMESASQIQFEIKGNSVGKYFVKLQLNNFAPFEYDPTPISIAKADFLTNNTKNSTFYLFFFLGGIVLMTFYNLALFFQLKKKNYLYIVAHNIMVLIFVLTQSGWLETTFINNYTHHETLILVLGNLSMITYLLLAISVLNFKKFNPKFHSLILKFIWVWPFFLIPIFFGFQMVALIIGSVLSLVVYNLVLIQTIKAIRRGSIAAKYFLAGNIFLYIGTTFSILMINEVIPARIFSLSAMEFVELGSMLELALFSLTLGALIQEVEKQLTKTKIEKKLAIETANFKDQFLENMSHEIRTPLNGVIGMLDVFSVSSKLDTTQKNQINIIQNSADSLLAIINDILDLSKLQAGKMEVNNAPVNINSFINQTKQLYSSITSSKNIDMYINIDENISRYIDFDASRVKQILNNLIANAVKFTPKDGQININLVLQDTFLKFEIQDTGIGISAEEQSKIFDNFSQVPEANTSRIDGTGLGLAICTKLVELMKGSFGVESELGNGSKFHFTIKYQPTDEIPAESRKKLITPKSSNSLNVLVVEDKPINQKVIQLMLNKIGHTVYIANNGIQALEIYPTQPFDIILMDVQMPEMDGIETTQKLKEKYTDLPPIIGLSANSMEGDAQKHIDIGFDDYLSKPVTLNMISEKLAKYNS